MGRFLCSNYFYSFVTPVEMTLNMLYNILVKQKQNSFTEIDIKMSREDTIMKRVLASGKINPQKHAHATTRTYTEKYPIYIEVPIRVSKPVIQQPEQKSSKNYRKPVAKHTKVRYNILVKLKSFTDKIHKKRQERMTKMANTKFKEAKIRAEVLQEVYDSLEEKIKYTKQYWGVIKKDDHQKVDWRTNEPIFDDNGLPIMEDKYGYIGKDEMTEDDELRIKVLREVIKSLEKLL